MRARMLRLGATRAAWRPAMAILCVALIASADSVTFAHQANEQQSNSTTPEPQKISNDQLDSLVAPIALYPDSLLSQTLVASTYPLGIVQFYHWMLKNSPLMPKELSETCATRPVCGLPMVYSV